MNQKGFVNILVIIGIVILAGVVGYFALNRQARLIPNPTPTPTPVAPASEPITVNGKTTCLTKKGFGQQTLECSIGLQGADGRQYVLKGYSDPEYKFAEVGLDVRVSGIFTPGEVPAADGNKYDVVGTIDVSSIKKVEGSTGPTGTGTVQPEDPNKSGLAPYPDLSIVSLSGQPFSIKFVVEHRSALNGKTILIHGMIVSTLLGEKACPPDRGMCAQPSVFLADITDKNRNPLYDLRILVGEEEQEKNYPIGKTIDLQVTVDGSKVAVVAHKTY